MDSLLLVHSPLVGPSTWGPLEQSAVERGFAVAVPDLTRVAQADPPGLAFLSTTAVESAAAMMPPIAVIGHSGAGALLPQIGNGLGHRLGQLVFVDAVIPPPHGAHRTSPAMKELLDEKTVHGTLAPWLDWWPNDTVAALLPDPADRAALIADMPSLPRSFYDEDVPVPDGWTSWACRYLRLSSSYDAEYEDAGTRGWRRSTIDGTHLSIYTEPDIVLDAIEELLSPGKT